MPPRVSILSAPRALAFRPKVIANTRTQLLASTRSYSSKNDKLQESEDKKGPNQDTLPSISEETSAFSKARGEAGPDLTQGTPVQEVVARDREGQDKLPKVMKDALKKDPSGKRSFSTWTARRQEVESGNGSGAGAFETAIIEAGTQELAPTDKEIDAITFENEVQPLAPMRPEDRFTRRYPAIVEQFVGMIMNHGKKGVAQKNIAIILNKLRTSPPPKISPKRPLLPGHPPASYLPLDPIGYLTLAVDSLAPLVRLKSQRGAAGGGASLMVPVPLNVRQRRRQAIQWIITTAGKRKSKGSGKGTYALRIADEVIAVIEGRSSVWDRRQNLHKQGVANRINANFKRK